MTLNRALRLLAWAAALWIGYEFLWYEQYKLAGPTLVFDKLSAWSGIPEKPFRLFVACMEMTAAALVLIPRTRPFGGLFAMGVMTGAIFFHLFTPLGVDPYEDGAQLFKEACFTWVMAAIVVLAHRAELLALAQQVLARVAPAAASR
jgi:uncharacterized membrane protein YphA (DoxX/SURF4 family)